MTKKNNGILGTHKLCFLYSATQDEQSLPPYYKSRKTTQKSRASAAFLLPSCCKVGALQSTTRLCVALRTTPRHNNTTCTSNYYSVECGKGHTYQAHSRYVVTRGTRTNPSDWQSTPIDCILRTMMSLERMLLFPSSSSTGLQGVGRRSGNSGTFFFKDG